MPEPDKRTPDKGIGGAPRGLMPKVLIAMALALVAAGFLMWRWSLTTGQVATPGARPPAANATAP